MPPQSMAQRLLVMPVTTQGLAHRGIHKGDEVLVYRTTGKADDLPVRDRDVVLAQTSSHFFLGECRLDSDGDGGVEVISYYDDQGRHISAFRLAFTVIGPVVEVRHRGYTAIGAPCCADGRGDWCGTQEPRQ